MSFQPTNTIKKTTFGAYMHWCPGCHSTHLIYVDGENRNGDKWRYEESEHGPSFYPEITLVKQVGIDEGVANAKQPLKFVQRVSCTYTIRDGLITFGKESLHALAGTSSALPNLPNFT